MTINLPKRQDSKTTAAVIQWLLETQHSGRMPITMDEVEGQPRRWITLRALRVLNWYSSGN